MLYCTVSQVSYTKLWKIARETTWHETDWRRLVLNQTRNQGAINCPPSCLNLAVVRNYRSVPKIIMIKMYRTRILLPAVWVQCLVSHIKWKTTSRGFLRIGCWERHLGFGRGKKRKENENLHNEKCRDWYSSSNTTLAIK